MGVSGSASSQQEAERICELVGGIPSVKSVQNNITVAAPEPAPAPVVEAEEVESFDGTGRRAPSKDPDTDEVVVLDRVLRDHVVGHAHY